MATKRPAYITAMRSASASTSFSSAETSRIALPASRAEASEEVLGPYMTGAHREAA